MVLFKCIVLIYLDSTKIYMQMIKRFKWIQDLFVVLMKLGASEAYVYSNSQIINSQVIFVSIQAKLK